mmetsp:Transcript_10251/g.33614  ORF Transcript_10251/g.33614 Transcript_10251/m.33614 type:complete len:142 (-) Transcript_10251:718-1143(-)
MGCKLLAMELRRLDGMAEATNDEEEAPPESNDPRRPPSLVRRLPRLISACELGNSPGPTLWRLLVGSLVLRPSLLRCGCTIPPSDIRSDSLGRARPGPSSTLLRRGTSPKCPSSLSRAIRRHPPTTDGSATIDGRCFCCFC